MDGRTVVVQGEQQTCELIVDALRAGGWSVRAKTDCDLDAALEESPTDIAFVGLDRVHKGTLDAFERAVRKHLNCPVIVLGDPKDTDLSAAAIQRGAFCFLTKPIHPADLTYWADKAYRYAIPVDRSIPVTVRRRCGGETHYIVCRSKGMRVLADRLLRVAPAANGTVLLQGETGSGKEIIAHALHQLGPRPGPFVPVRCPAVPGTLLEGELFGYERGAFPGAAGTKPGLVEVANGGTLFLDEIGDMPLSAQSKLLRVLQERAVRRVGSTVDLPVSILLVAASNQDLLRLVHEGKFREDLYYRLVVVPLCLPPLRERREDILPLARSFLLEFCRESGQPVPLFRSQTEEALLNHWWPGNVRELQNWAERASLLGLAGPLPHMPWLQSGQIDPHVTMQPHVWDAALPASSPPAAGGVKTESTPEIITLSLRRCSLEEAERAVIRQALSQAEGNKNRAARILGINRATLYRKIARFGWTNQPPYQIVSAKVLT